MRNRARMALMGLPFFLMAFFLLLILFNGRQEHFALPVSRKNVFPSASSVAKSPSPLNHKTSSASVTPPTKPIRSREDTPPVEDALSPDVTITPVADGETPGTAVSYEALYDNVSLLMRQYKEREAIAILKQIIKSAPDDLRAYALLGDIYYKQDELSEATSIWKKILEKEPSNEKIRFLLGKTEREQKTHTSFVHESTRHFTIKFEGAENRGLYKTVLDALEEAYGEVGRALSFYPTEEVLVFLYTNQQFFDVTLAPAWSGGLFDGKIRIPTKGSETQLDQLRKILFHEYVHAVIHQMTERGVSKTGERNAPNVPTWLHEGVAQYLEPAGIKNAQAVDGAIKSRVKQMGKEGIIRLPLLHGPFVGIGNPLAVRIAYDESLSAVLFLVEKFGLWRLKMLLEDLSVKRNIDEAMQSALLISYEEFQSGWENKLRS